MNDEKIRRLRELAIFISRTFSSTDDGYVNIDDTAILLCEYADLLEKAETPADAPALRMDVDTNGVITITNLQKITFAAAPGELLFYVRPQPAVAIDERAEFDKFAANKLRRMFGVTDGYMTKLLNTSETVADWWEIWQARAKLER